MAVAVSPEADVPVIVYVVAVLVSVGVPDIRPVEALKVRGEGGVGVIAYEVTGAPVSVIE